LTKNLVSIKSALGEHSDDPNGEIQQQMANEIYSSDFIQQSLIQMQKLDFESRKEFVLIFTALMKRKIGEKEPTVDFLAKNPSIIENLMNSYDNGDVAITTGSILRETLRSEIIAKIILQSQSFWKFFKYAEYANFDVASDSFQTFKEILLKHKQPIAEFLDKNYDQFFVNYLLLINSDNYVTKRKSLKLLSEVLIERSNFKIMTKFISDSNNLKLAMNLLRDKSRNIQLESFHVFKLFVANPNKTPQIIHIFYKNRDKLIGFLSGFQNDKEDEQFTEEKQYLIKQLGNLPPDPLGSSNSNNSDSN